MTTPAAAAALLLATALASQAQYRGEVESIDPAGGERGIVLKAVPGVGVRAHFTNDRTAWWVPGRPRSTSARDAAAWLASRRGKPTFATVTINPDSFGVVGQVSLSAYGATPPPQAPPPVSKTPCAPGCGCFDHECRRSEGGCRCRDYPGVPWLPCAGGCRCGPRPPQAPPPPRSGPCDRGCNCSDPQCRADACPCGLSSALKCSQACACEHAAPVAMPPQAPPVRRPLQAPPLALPPIKVTLTRSAFTPEGKTGCGCKGICSCKPGECPRGQWTHGPGGSKHMFCQCGCGAGGDCCFKSEIMGRPTAAAAAALGVIPGVVVPAHHVPLAVPTAAPCSSQPVRRAGACHCYDCVANHGHPCGCGCGRGPLYGQPQPYLRPYPPWLGLPRW